ncbi:MAG: 50S ribosomal protein L15 [Pelagibacteraceae bacterium]|jgi:large subunit ribosomal protein L15|nr:MAG: 50S ribosomal protein L15 [alpha proteobacterium HIMB114]|tara:strand:+ start:1391 stop:1846 length:456 start_codon:yes stop_codon:yes gene_type:complete
MVKLNNFSKKIHKAKKRVGRGIGSGLGKTSGRGAKGQKSRSGVSIKSYEGGQMPLYRRLPKRGFNSLYKREKNVAINLDKITKLIEAKKLDSSKSIDLRKFLLKAKKPSKLKVKVLGSGDIKIKISILADKFSETAKSKIEKAGGSVEIIK